MPGRVELNKSKEVTFLISQGPRFFIICILIPMSSAPPGEEKILGSTQHSISSLDPGHGDAATRGCKVNLESLQEAQPQGNPGSRSLGNGVTYSECQRGRVTSPTRTFFIGLMDSGQRNGDNIQQPPLP